jgi:AcrR family transcriptional regulator
MFVNSLPPEQEGREHILTVAAQLFLERGFANVSIRDICERAQVTPPTIYHYFGNKDKLFQAVVRRTLTLRDFRNSLKQEIDNHSDPESQLCALINHYLQAFPRDFYNPGMWLKYSTQVFTESTQQVMLELQAIFQLAIDIITQGQAGGAFRPTDPYQTTMYLMNLLMAYLLLEQNYEMAHDPSQTAPFIFDMFMNGLRQP